MVNEDWLDKHGTHEKYVIRTYDSTTDWLETTKRDMVYVLSGYGWQILYQRDAEYGTGNKLVPGTKFLLPDKVKYKILNKENIDSKLTLKIEFI